MAITEQQKTSLLGVTSFMFNYAPDQASFERFESIIENNPSFYALGTDLARTEAYTSQFEEGATLADKINVILTRLGLEEGELGYERGVNFITQRIEQDGIDEGQVLMEIGEKLLQETPPEGLEDAAAVLRNKIAVSDAYRESGIEGYSSETMPELLANITAEQESVDAALSEIEEYTPPVDPSALTAALEAYEAAVEAQGEAEAAYSEAVVEAGLENNADDFDADKDYVAEAEAAVQTATANLATARANIGSDAAVNNAVTQAQAAVNAYTDTRYNEDGNVATEGTTYTLAQLQARAANAQAALDANLAAGEETADLAQDLKDAIALYLSEGNEEGEGALQDLNGAINSYLADPSADDAEAGFLEAVQTAYDALSDEDGESELADVARAEPVEALLVTLNERADLAEAAATSQTAFEAAEDIAAADDAFDDVTFSDPADTDLTSALATQAERDGLIETLQTAQDNKSSVETAAGDYEAAQQAVEEAAEALGYDIQDIDSASLLGTDEADLFIFDAETLDDASITAVSINGFESDDVLFLGSDYVLGTEGAGDNNVLEVFITEVGGNAVLNVENTAFGSASEDFTSITLTGIAAADVTIESGVVSIA